MIFLKGQIVKSSKPIERHDARKQRRQEAFRRRAATQRRAARVKRFITPSLWVLFALVIAHRPPAPALLCLVLRPYVVIVMSEQFGELPQVFGDL